MEYIWFVFTPILLLLIILIPMCITIKNIIDIVEKEEYSKGKIIFNIISIVICLSYTLFGIKNYIRTGINNQNIYLDYNITTPILTSEIEDFPPMYHAPIASWSMPTVITILSFGIISYIILRINKKKLPPLLSVILLSSTLICSIYMGWFIVQVAFAHINEEYIFSGGILVDLALLIFPINYILCTIKLQKDIIKNYKSDKKPKQYKNKTLNKFSNIINKSENWPLIQFIIAIPVLTIMICILLLFGQRPAEAIRAFFETSDWNLSTFVSQPIPVEYVGHYLCTVSLKGHKKIVKPTRIGIRYGNKIIVNRQLCIANAFEDLIKEKTPRFHYFIRTIYDKYGYPLSKHINKPWQADLIYIIMKPLEWIFLITLYLFDINPENRIAVQYIGSNKII